jgi:hypothetical protein
MYRESLLLPRTISGVFGRAALLAVLILLACPPRALRADDIYKSVDSEGHVVYSDQPPEGLAAQKSSVRIGDTQTLPPVIHFCWTNCFTLTLDKGLYRRADGSDETWTVERFTSTSVALRRHDVPASWNGFSGDVAYEGQVSNGRLINITVAGKPTSGIDAAWGIALDTLPGSNAERDQRSSASSETHALPVSPAMPPGESVADGEVRASEAPPPLVDDEQPPCSTEGYLWTPGFWSWGRGRYYWVPGIWVPPPRVGALWTPGYWEFVGAAYVFHPGYWAPHIGYYGGINYGFGYAGVGFAGGRWVGNSFAYNRAANNLSNNIRNTYSETVANNIAVKRASYSGGPGGTTSVQTPQERANAAPTVHNAPRAIVAHSTAAPPLRADAAPSTGDPVTVASAPANAGTRPLGTPEQSAAKKPTGPITTKAPRHPMQ